nr:hypothetical protein [Corynebacterium glutamicum]
MAFIPNLPNPRQALRFARQSKSTHGDHHAALGLALRGDRQRKDQGRLLRLCIGYSPVSDHVRRASANNTIKERLKNPDDEFELVIVKDIAFFPTGTAVTAELQRLPPTYSASRLGCRLLRRVV